MERRQRLSRSRDFDAVYRQGRSVSTRLLTLHWFAREDDPDGTARVGLAIPRAVLAGYDWGGRAACVVAALWPERCAGLVSLNSYNIQDIARAMVPDTPENERSLWYQYYFHSERGRAGLAANRRALTRLLWQLWSPS